MREFLIRLLSLEKAHRGYHRIQVTEFQDVESFPTSSHEVLLWNDSSCVYCTCREGEDRQARCEHVALAKTWKRQGMPSGTDKNINQSVRVYTVDDAGVIGYYNKGLHKSLSSVERVLGVGPQR